ncbi:hypothetical protein vseg_020996 [Gypsophila vaccaria]
MPDLAMFAADYGRLVYPHNHPLIISLDVSNHLVYRCLVDTEAYTNIHYKEPFDKMGLDIRHFKPTMNSLYKFSGAGTMPLGTITLPFTIDEGETTKNVYAEFIVMDAPSAYHALIRRVPLD